MDNRGFFFDAPPTPFSNRWTIRHSFCCWARRNSIYNRLHVIHATWPRNTFEFSFSFLPGQDNYNALHIAAMYSREDVVKLLLSKRSVDPHATGGVWAFSRFSHFLSLSRITKRGCYFSVICKYDVAEATNCRTLGRVQTNGYRYLHFESIAGRRRAGHQAESRWGE